MTTEITESWYSSLVEELQDIITEKVFEHTFSLIECWHLVGTRILQENDSFERSKIYGQDIVQRIAESLGKKQRTIYYAVKFASMYPDLNLLNEGKNISWSHLINKYLTAGEEKPIKISPTEMIKQIKQLLQIEWLKAHQEVMRTDTDFTELSQQQAIVDFIRYLQDQVEKITNGGTV